MVIGCDTQIKVAMSIELYCYSGDPRPWLKNLYTITAMSYLDEVGLQHFHSLLMEYFKQYTQSVFRWRFDDV